MMTNESNDEPPSVGASASRERSDAEKRLYGAELDSVRSSVVVDMLDAAIRSVRELHVENGYAPKLRAIFRS